MMKHDNMINNDIILKYKKNELKIKLKKIREILLVEHWCVININKTNKKLNKNVIE